MLRRTVDYERNGLNDNFAVNIRLALKLGLEQYAEKN